MLKVATREGLGAVVILILIALTASGKSYESAEDGARLPRSTSAFRAIGNDSDISDATAAAAAALSSVGNCTRCAVWRGDNCTTYRPCVFCNASVECAGPLVCRDDICTELPPGGSKCDLIFLRLTDSRRRSVHSALKGRDPLGKVIALILLTIFLLTLVTLCLRIFSNSCSGSRRCCVIQCAVQVQCCCQWKAGRLRILPSGAGGPGGGSAVPELHAGSAADDARENRAARGSQQQQQQQLRRANLFPPPPPAYIEIFPEGERESRRSELLL